MMKNVTLLSLRSGNRASVSARTAVDAVVSVDYVLAITLADSAYRALIGTSAAGDAIIRNYVCHCSFTSK
jgi:hypothetical protein